MYVVTSISIWLIVEAEIGALHKIRKNIYLPQTTSNLYYIALYRVHLATGVYRTMVF